MLANTTAPIARGLDDITPGFIERALRAGGQLDAASRVKDVRLDAIGSGLMARSTRATITVEPADAAAPESVVVKYATDDPGSLAMAHALGMYRVEVQFYRDLAPRLTGLRTPGCHAAAFDEETGAFTLVLEDLRDARPGDALTPSTPEQLSAAIETLVQLQAPLWGSPRLTDLDWLADPHRTHLVFDALSGAIDPFIDRFGDKLADVHVDICRRVVPQAGRWARSWQPPLVIQHGDFRPDNFMYGTRPGAPALTLIDFQTVRLAPPGADLAYLLGSAMSIEDRRERERDLVAGYHAGLEASGVTGFALDDAWSAYRAGALYGLMLFVGGAAQIESTERGDLMIASQAALFAQMAIDLDAASAAGLP